MRWWGQLKAIWDNAGQLVELREEIATVQTACDQLRADVTRLDERTRKQVQREKKGVEDFVDHEIGKIPLGHRVDIIRAARIKGIL